MCASQTGYLAHGNSKSEASGRSRYKNNSKRVVRKIEKRNVRTNRKSPKQGLINAEPPRDANPPTIY